MTRVPLALRLAPALLLALLGVPARAQDAPAPDPAPASPPTAAHGWAPVQFHLDASLRIGHSSNLYHAQKRHEPDFETETAPYQRYYRMKGPGDVEGRLELDLAWRFKHASKRAIGLRLRSRQFTYVDNEIANRNDFRFDATFDVSRDDRLRLSTTYSPEHFRKNLKHEAFPGITVYERADVRDTALSLRYDRDWSKMWSTSLSLGQGRRDYATPFDGRDEHADSWSVGARCEVTKRVSLELSLGQDETSTPTSVEEGVPKDRSHDDDVVSLGVDLNLRHGWRVQQGVHRIRREYTTDEPLDTSRYGRTDRRWELDAVVEKKLTDSWTLAFDAAWMSNDSGRHEAGTDDARFDTDDLDLGFTVSFRK